MSTRTLFDAVRADTRAKLGVIRSLSDVNRAFDHVSGCLDCVRETIERRDKATPSADPDREVHADLLALDTLVAELALQLSELKLAIDDGLFGASRPDPEPSA